MTDEEKKAIEHFNDLNHLYEIGVDTLKYTESEYDNSEILLNLIEKQEKGIRDNYFLYIKEKNNYDKLLVLYEKQQKEIESLKENNKSFKQQYNQQVLKNAKIVNFYENDDLHKELYKLRKEIEEKSKLINSMKKFLLDIGLMSDYLESEGKI